MAIKNFTTNSGYTTSQNVGASVQPSLLLDFAASRSLDPRITFARASTATFVNAKGFLETAAANVPRFTYNAASGYSEGLLIETNSTNLFTYSGDLSNAAWVKVGGLTTPSITEIAPDGTATAYTIEDTSIAAYQNYSRTVTIPNDATAYTASLYVRKTTGGTSSTFGVNMSISGGTLVAANYRLDTDTGAKTGDTFTVEDFGNWWRISFTVSNNTTGNITLAVSIYPAAQIRGTPSDTVTAVGTATIWGIQVEALPIVTSYIPTTTAAATRAREDATITGTNFSSWFNQTEGTIVASNYSSVTGASNATNPARFGVIGDDTNNNRFLMYLNQISAAVGGVASGNTPSALNALNASFYPKATRVWAYKKDDAAFNSRFEGLQTTSTFQMPISTGIALGQNYPLTSVAMLNGAIARFAYYPKRLSNEELKAIV